ncbi:TrlF family AAA-like ATPase [Burkholderia pseudomallei]|uniref:TrlF family AAA-like ATPase n=1 Tax=Burkholderia pseudomallei TaxID=28450 RepID=UPI000A1A12EF|nr:phosphoesterase [Burkholderia pseudomallei]ARL23920.1 phosphoesterase [Burkholderia pseudomallei]
MDLGKIRELPSGARFYRCAFQVNTFDYVTRHKRPTQFTDEASYNDALIAACHANGVEVIALADHYRIRPAAALIEAARAAGIVVFPGFEAVSKEGVHFLCLFDPSMPLSGVQGRIHACGIHNDDKESPLGELHASELLEQAADWPAQVIAAHIAGAGGLFRALQAGQARSAIWRHDNLHACSLPGPISAAPEDVRPILENKNADYAREHPIAVLNCQDVCSPEDLAKAGTTCYVKMTRPTVEGLRQAFLDPGSRVRLSSDPAPEEHIEFLGLAWETEGFLRGCRLHFNENLNVLIGGRGAGKSSIIESLRYVLGIEPIGEEAKRVHNGIVQGVLRSGTKISLAVQSYRPDKRLFFIERTVPNPPRVIDNSGNVLPVKPLDIVRGVAVFGQNELAELARSPDKLTTLLHRFIPTDAAHDSKTDRVADALKTTRQDILDDEAKIQKDRESLAALPGIEETLKRYREAGVEEKLKSQALIIKAEGVVTAAKEAITPFANEADSIETLIPIAQDFLSEQNLEGLPAYAELASLRETIATFEAEARATVTRLRDQIGAAEKAIDVVATKVAAAKATAQADYEQTLRDLQKVKIDGNEFIQLKRDLTQLGPIKAQMEKTAQKLNEHQQKRRNDLATWEDLKRERYQRLERAAKKVSRELPNRLRVTVAFGRNREPLASVLKQEVGGRLSETIAALSGDVDLSVSALAEACRQGAASLTVDFGIPTAQAERLAKAGSQLPMLIEELELPHITEIELNVGPENAPPEWRKLDQLSTGQKATALLYLLLLESEGPLVLDQPEDNLDNRFISEGVVPKIRGEKRRRQFIFSTHNANIPVLGDAELILAMRAVGESGDGHAEVPPAHMGAIDKETVAALVEEILEGGKEAFQTRRLKYGF